MIESIGRQGGQPRVLDRASGRKVIEGLKRRVVEPKHLMDRVIEEAADSRRTDAARFRLQIKHLADHPGLPEESAVKPGSVPPQVWFEFRDHSQRKRAIAGDFLAATDLGGVHLKGTLFFSCATPSAAPVSSASHTAFWGPLGIVHPEPHSLPEGLVVRREVKVAFG